MPYSQLLRYGALEAFYIHLPFGNRYTMALLELVGSGVGEGCHVSTPNFGLASSGLARTVDT